MRELPVAWCRVPLQDVVQSVDYGISEALGTDTRGVPVLRMNNIQDDRFDLGDLRYSSTPVPEKMLLQYGDVLFNRTNSIDHIGKTAMWRDPLLVASFASYLVRLNVDVQRVLPAYLEQWLMCRQVRRQVRSISTVAVQQVNVNPSRLLEINIDFPVDLMEQQRIVDVLDSFTELEWSIEASITKLRNVRQGVLLASLESVASEEPAAGWARVSLKDVVPSAEYGLSEALNGDARGVPVLRMNNIQNGRIDADDLRYCPVPVPAKLFLRRGDVLFNRTNSMEHIGKAAMWRDELSSATFASYLVRLIPDLQRVTPEYLIEWLMHPLVRQRVRSISTVAVQQVNVNPSRLRELEIDIPVDLAEQRRIVATLEACDEQIGRENEELNKLRDLKQGLVDDLLSGRVTASGLVA
ncbi:restriction endonuclease subunit S [Streptomyces sp. NPDC048385]|uniref:restriction endonuclease subunit S n=1 Tax=unclassified Streptomyces TaxID=2593676 RepID=UPI0034375800